MLPGTIDNPGKHSLRSFYSNIMSPQFEYYFITLASPGRLYPCRWHHARYHCKVIVGATYQGVVELREINLEAAQIGPALRQDTVYMSRTLPLFHENGTTRAELCHTINA